MSAAFWSAAAALALLAAAFLIVPAWRRRRREGRGSWLGIGAGLATIPVAAALYLQITTWSPEEPAQIPPEVARLAEYLAAHPDDVDGWTLLGRTYVTLGQYALGRQALTEAWNRAAAPGNPLKLALGEAMILTDRFGISDQAAQLIEDVLRAEPGNQKALWYGGAVAAERGLVDVACARWQAVLATQPPPDIAELTGAYLSSQGCAPAHGAAEAGGAAGGGTVIELQVSLGAGRSLESLGGQAALFIFARAPGGGPPVAVIRQPVDALPGEFTLSDANTMIAGRSLDDFPELSLVARISRSGQPGEQSGDLFAETVYRQGGDRRVELVIDQVVP